MDGWALVEPTGLTRMPPHAHGEVDRLQANLAMCHHEIERMRAKILHQRAVISVLRRELRDAKAKLTEAKTKTEE